MSSSQSVTGSRSKRKPLYPRGWGSGNVAYVGTFRAFSMAVLGRSSLEIGDKIILPPQALQSINRLKLPFPLIFEVRKWQKSSFNMLSQNEVMNQYKRRIENIYRSTNPAKINKINKWLRKYKNNPHELYTKICKTYGIIPKAKITYNNNNKKMRKQKEKSFGKQYCSVYEFSSPQSDSAYLPHWMMQNLGIEEGDKVELESQFNVEKGTFCKLQPFKQEFMDKVSVIGYKATLEHSLRHYSVLSLNQRIVVEFNHFPYQCIVRETKPDHAISILGSTDLEIEFESPLEMIGETQQKEELQSEENCYSSSSSSSSNVVVTKQIDGALLKKLGVPLDYNEQNNLATMIQENRKLIEENESRFDNDNSERILTIHNTDDEAKEEEKEKEQDKVKCNNCGKYIHSMSIQMHEVHCQREYVLCKICNECIRHQNESIHFEEFHREISCICDAICVGKLCYDKHKSDECRLRLVECSFCLKSNIAWIELEKHEIVCKESTVICSECNESYKLKNGAVHDCGIICVLCEERIIDSKDKLLHLLTICKERRAICNYCGVFRKCIDMEEHRKYCGSRSEKCSKCNQFVSLMNMEPHLQSNCQWFNNNQLSSKNIKHNNIQDKLKSLDLKDINNPYIDEELLDTSSLFGLLKSNNINTLNTNKQLCPHCTNNDILMNEEEFHIHIAIKHQKLVDDSLTQTIMASFANPDILNDKKTTNKKRKRKISSDSMQSKAQKWSCNVCSFANTKSKQRCIMCNAPKSNL